MDHIHLCDFEEREDLTYSGLKIYINACLGDYLTPEQVDTLAETLRRFRIRPADVDFCDDYCSPISLENSMRNFRIPRKTLRKDECAVFFYNVAPYALVNRNQAARLAKRLFPNFFASETTINSSFTRHSNLSTSELARIAGITIENLPSHTTAHVERTFYELGYNNKNKSHGRK